MPKITLDSVEYNSEDLSEHGNVTLKSLQLLEIELQRLQNEISIYKTAQKTYLMALRTEITNLSIEPINPSESIEK
jgi:hypothetical protein